LFIWKIFVAEKWHRFSRTCSEHTRAAGFSLIEVLIALAIVGLALAAAAGTFGAGVAGHAAARDAATALAVAEEKLAGAGVTAPLRESRSEGSFADRFDWQLTVASYDDPAKDRLAGANATLRLYRVAISVAWQDGHRQRQLALATLRLGRVPP